MTAAPITQATGAHAGCTGATSAARHQLSAAHWSRAIAQASGGAAAAAGVSSSAADAPVRDDRFRELKAGDDTLNPNLSSEPVSVTASIPDHAHAARHANAQPSSGGSHGHHQEDNSTGNTAAIVNLVLVAAPVLDGNTRAARAATKSDAPSHDAADLASSGKAAGSSGPEAAFPATPAASKAETSPDASQGSEDLVGEDLRFAVGVTKPPLPSGGQSVTAERSHSPSSLPPAVAASDAQSSTASLIPVAANPNQITSGKGALPRHPATKTNEYVAAAPVKSSGAVGASALDYAAAPVEMKLPAALPAGAAPVAAVTVAGTNMQQAAPQSAAAPFSAGAPVPATPSGLAAAVAAMHKSGDASTILRLDPAGLGALTVHVSIGEGSRINVQFTPAVPQTAHIISSNLDDLRQAMALAGLSLGQAFVDTGEGRNSGGSGDFRRPAQSRHYPEIVPEQGESSSASEAIHPSGMVSAYA